MADQARPLDKNEAPDTARSYERAKPEKEHGMGQLSSPKAPTHDDPATPPVPNAKDPKRQINAQDGTTSSQ